MNMKLENQRSEAMSESKKQAFIEGFGEDAEVYLYGVDENGEHLEDIPWPKDWPSYVTAEFLEHHGFDVVSA